MIRYASAKLPGGCGRAGGPGMYGTYTFHGTDIDVYGMRSPVVGAGGQSHPTGKIRVSVDGKVRGVADLASPAWDPSYKAFSVSGLSADGNHVLQVEPVGGWVVLSSIRISTAARRRLGAHVDDQNLAAYFPCTDGTGAATKDASGHGYTGYLVAGAGWAGDAGQDDGALSFSSPGGVEVDSHVIDNTQSFTVVARVKLASVNGFQTFVSMDGDRASGFFLQLRGDTHEFAFSVAPSFAGSTISPEPGQWYQLAGSYDAATRMLCIYVDGQLCGSQQIRTRPSPATGRVVIGRGKYNGSYTDFAMGDINDVRFFDTALPEDDVAQLYAATR